MGGFARWRLRRQAFRRVQKLSCLVKICFFSCFFLGQNRKKNVHLYFSSFFVDPLACIKALLRLY